MLEARETHKLNSLMHLHAAMSPLSKSSGVMSPIKGYSQKFVFDTNIANPFIEKMGIIPH